MDLDPSPPPPPPGSGPLLPFYNSQTFVTPSTAAHGQVDGATPRRSARIVESPQHQNTAHIFGTREEVERQGTNYVSPITDLFTNAYRSASQNTAADPPNPQDTIQRALSYHSHIPELPPPPRNNAQQTPRRRMHIPEIPRHQSSSTTLYPRLPAAQRIAEDRAASVGWLSENTNAPARNPRRQVNSRRTRTRSGAGESGQASSLFGLGDRNTSHEHNLSADDITAYESAFHRRPPMDSYRLPDGHERTLPRVSFRQPGDPCQYPIGFSQAHLAADTQALSNAVDQYLQRRPENLISFETSDELAYGMDNPYAARAENELQQIRYPGGGDFATRNPFLREPASAHTHPSTTEDRQAHERILGIMHERNRRGNYASMARQRPVGLDIDETRPPPLTKEQMIVERECKVCMEQLATVAIIPCGKPNVFLETDSLG